MSWSFALLGLSLSLAACRPQDLPPTETAPANPSPTPVRLDLTRQPVTVEPLTPTDTEELIVTPWPTAPLPDDASRQALIEQARSDLATRLQVAPEAINFLAFESVTWPDGGLGCPTPGMAYIQVPVEGYRIMLGYAKRVFAYHGGSGRGPFLCENPAGATAEPAPGFTP